MSDPFRNHIVGFLTRRLICCKMFVFVRNVSKYMYMYLRLTDEFLLTFFQGFGHLLPSFEDGPFLGVIYDSCTFPQHDRTDKPSTRFTVSQTLILKGNSLT